MSHICVVADISLKRLTRRMRPTTPHKAVQPDRTGAASQRHWNYIGSMLANRLRRWPAFSQHRFNVSGSIRENSSRQFRGSHVTRWQQSAPASISTELTRYVKPMPIKCWAAVSDVGPTLNRHWFNVSCLLGCHARAGAGAWIGGEICLAGIIDSVTGRASLAGDRARRKTRYRVLTGDDNIVR